MQLQRKRLKIFTGILVIIFILLMLALTYRMAFVSDDLILSMANQQLGIIRTIYPRGIFLDRNGIKLTGIPKKNDGILYTDYINCDVAQCIIGDVKIDTSVTTQDAVEGISGLNKVYNDILSTGQFPYYIMGLVDAKGNIISTDNVFIKSASYPIESEIMLTIDYHLQSEAETLLANYIDEKQYKNIALVLSDINTGEILVLASQGSYLNTAVISYQPGSVFKIITAGCALEEGLISLESTFTCTGEVLADGIRKEACKHGGHGTITLAQAFASSCNCTFYEINKMLNINDEDGNILGNAALNKMTELNIGTYNNPVKNDFILNYDYSYDFITDQIYNQTGTFNVALGQGDIQLMPLTVNKIISAIANDGVMNEPVLIKNIKKAGINEQIDKYNDGKQINIFSEATCQDLKVLLRQVCIDGTASGYERVHEYVAGKTGTAEHLDDKYCHAWFTGFFPYEMPKYAMTVLIEEGGSSINAVKIYNDMLKVIENYDNDIK
jgi:cell division protein FtsI/penicillin-binding protein 2